MSQERYSDNIVSYLNQIEVSFKNFASQSGFDPDTVSFALTEKTLNSIGVLDLSTPEKCNLAFKSVDSSYNRSQLNIYQYTIISLITLAYKFDLEKPNGSDGYLEYLFNYFTNVNIFAEGSSHHEGRRGGDNQWYGSDTKIPKALIATTLNKVDPNAQVSEIHSKIGDSLKRTKYFGLLMQDISDIIGDNPERFPLSGLPLIIKLGSQAYAEIQKEFEKLFNLNGEYTVTFFNHSPQTLKIILEGFVNKKGDRTRMGLLFLLGYAAGRRDRMDQIIVRYFTPEQFSRFKAAWTFATSMYFPFDKYQLDFDSTLYDVAPAFAEARELRMQIFEQLFSGNPESLDLVEELMQSLYNKYQDVPRFFPQRIHVQFGHLKVDPLPPATIEPDIKVDVDVASDSEPEDLNPQMKWKALHIDRPKEINDVHPDPGKNLDLTEPEEIIPSKSYQDFQYGEEILHRIVSLTGVGFTHRVDEELARLFVQVLDSNDVIPSVEFREQIYMFTKTKRLENLINFLQDKLRDKRIDFALQQLRINQAKIDGELTNMSLGRTTIIENSLSKLNKLDQLSGTRQRYITVYRVVSHFVSNNPNMAMELDELLTFLWRLEGINFSLERSLNVVRAITHGNVINMLTEILNKYTQTRQHCDEITKTFFEELLLMGSNNVEFMNQCGLVYEKIKSLDLPSELNTLKQELTNSWVKLSEPALKILTDHLQSTVSLYDLILRQKAYRSLGELHELADSLIEIRNQNLSTLEIATNIPIELGNWHNALLEIKQFERQLSQTSDFSRVNLTVTYTRGELPTLQSDEVMIMDNLANVLLKLFPKAADIIKDIEYEDSLIRDTESELGVIAKIIYSLQHLSFHNPRRIIPDSFNLPSRPNRIIGVKHLGNSDLYINHVLRIQHSLYLLNAYEAIRAVAPNVAALVRYQLEAPSKLMFRNFYAVITESVSILYQDYGQFIGEEFFDEHFEDIKEYAELRYFIVELREIESVFKDWLMHQSKRDRFSMAHLLIATYSSKYGHYLGVSNLNQVMIAIGQHIESNPDIENQPQIQLFRNQNDKSTKKLKASRNYGIDHLHRMRDDADYRQQIFNTELEDYLDKVTKINNTINALGLNLFGLPNQHSPLNYLGKELLRELLINLLGIYWRGGNWTIKDDIKTDPYDNPILKLLNKDPYELVFGRADNPNPLSDIMDMISKAAHSPLTEEIEELLKTEADGRLALIASLWSKSIDFYRSEVREIYLNYFTEQLISFYTILPNQRDSKIFTKILTGENDTDINLETIFYTESGLKSILRDEDLRQLTIILINNSESSYMQNALLEIDRYVQLRMHQDIFMD